MICIHKSRVFSAGELVIYMESVLRIGTGGAQGGNESVFSFLEKIFLSS